MNRFSFRWLVERSGCKESRICEMRGRRHKELCLLWWTLAAVGFASCQQSDAPPEGKDSTGIHAALFPARTRPMRLPNATFPLEYHLHIVSKIHLGNLNFKGNVTIDVHARESTDEVVLHAVNLSNFVVTGTHLDSDTVLRDLTFTYDAQSHFLVIHAYDYNQLFEGGQTYRLEILYDGVMNEKTTGLYWLLYRDRDNQKRFQAATQFEPTHAREALPCYDEPAFKANFTIRVTHGGVYNVISNMEARSVVAHSDGDLATTTFHTTPPISTYLVAFVISNFGNISETFGGVTHRVFTPPTAGYKGEYQLRMAGRITAAIEGYLGVDYPLRKMDHVALNKNYGAAMENWGLITYKEECLLYNPDSPLLGLRAPLTIVHEIAHQWFGNLVSPAWWSYIWLNEGFATYLSYIVIDLIEPKFKAMDHFLIESDNAYYYNKFVANRHPITSYVEEESNIVKLFDTITYQKAACVIRMFHHAFTEETFLRGIRLFLTKFQYTSANELDLFHCIQIALREDVSATNRGWADSAADMMLSWTQSKLSPLVKVTHNRGDNTITVRQLSRNLQLAEHVWVPLNFASGSDHNFSHTQADYVMPPIGEVTLSPIDLGLVLAPDDWLIVNKQQTGFYHVLYDDDNLRSIAIALHSNHSAIHVYNRADIFRSIRPLIEHNDMDSVEVIFDLLSYLSREENWLVWSSVQTTLDILDYNLSGTTAHTAYKAFVRGLIGPIYRRFFTNALQAGREATEIPGSENLFFRNLLTNACAVELQECLDYVRRIAFDYIFDHIHIGYTMRDSYLMTDAILCSAMKHLTNEEFSAVLELLATSNQTTEHFDDVFNSLHCVKDTSQIRQYLDIVMGVNVSRFALSSGDSLMHIKRLCRSNIGARPLIWESVLTNHLLLMRRPYFIDVFNTLAEYVTKDQLEEFRQLHEKVSGELHAVNNDHSRHLLPVDSDHIGVNSRMRETFLDKFGDDIERWLTQDRKTAVNTAAFGARSSGSCRVGSLLRLAGRVYRNVFSLRIKKT